MAEIYDILNEKCLKAILLSGSWVACIKHKLKDFTQI